MILADKIIEERKRNGWSQEELAEKLQVSRQSISKWEGAQSMPDLARVIQMAEVFGVTTDYLLKDEIETPENIEDNGESVAEPKRRMVSIEEANNFMDVVKNSASKISTGVSMCILSPVLLIILGGISEEGIGGISEGVAMTIGLIALFCLVAAAVFIFIFTGMKLNEYEYLEKEPIETAYGVLGIVKEKKQSYATTFAMGISVGVVLCILSVIPILIAGSMGAADYVCALMTAILFIFVAVGVNIIVRVSMVNGSFQKLLQEGDYTEETKNINKKMEPIASIYWTIVLAGYLAWSFITGNWNFTWIVWPVAAIAYGLVLAIGRMIQQNK